MIAGADLLKGGGEMGALTRSYDWSQNSLGAIREWPVSLRVQVQLMLNSRFPMLIFWGPDLITFYNDAFRPSLGDNGKHPGSLGQPGEVSWAESWPTIGPLIYGIMAGGEAVWFEDQKLPIYRDGTMGYAYWTYSFSPITDDSGTVNGVLVTCSETTKAVESIQALTQTAERLDNVFAQVSAGIAQADLQGRFTEVNERFCQMLGYSREELLTQSINDVTHPKDRDRSEAMLARLLVDHKDFMISKRYVRKDGTILWVNNNDAVLEDTLGTKSLVIVSIDNTVQKLQEQKLIDSETRFRSLVEESPTAICLFLGRDMTIALANDLMLQSWGKGQEVIGKRLADALPELEGQPFFEVLDRVYTTGETFNATEAPATVALNGELVTYYFNYTCKALRNEAGEIYGIINTNIDVTEQVEASQRLEASEASLQNAITLAKLGTFSVDAATQAITVSARTAEWFGFDSPTTASAASVIGCLEETEQDHVRAHLQNALQPGSDGRYDVVHSVINQKTGHRIILHAIGQALLDSSGQPVSVEGIAQDITIQRELQLALEQQVQSRTEELAATVEELRAANEELAQSNESLLHSNEELAQYAYVASHDLQEPLRKIQVFSGMLLGKADLSASSQQLTTKIGQSATRMALLIRDLLEFSRLLKSDSLYVPTDLNEIVAAVWSDFELIALEKNAELRLESLPTVEAVNLQMNQVFYNLISNALKFASPETTPVITVSAEVIDEPEVARYVARPLAFARYYRICVQDNGIGFEQQYAEQIFEVFKRLHGRDAYPGSGIGLALCRRILAGHNGALYTQSAPGKGSVFCLILPDRQSKATTVLPQNLHW